MKTVNFQKKNNKKLHLLEYFSTNQKHHSTRVKNCFTIGLIMLVFIDCQGFAQTNNDWSEPISIASWQEKYTHSAHSNMVINKKDGKIFVVWEEHNNFDNDEEAQICYTEFDGTHWLQSTAVTDTGSMDWTPDIAVDTLGNPHIVWGEYLSGEVFYKYYDGAKWSIPVNVSENGGGSYYPRIAIDSANKVHIVWHDDTRESDPSVFYRNYDGVHWSETFIVSDTLEYSIFPRIVIDSKDNLHITWCSRQPPNDNRDVFYRGYIRGKWLPIIRLTYDTLYSIEPVITLYTNDLPIVFWEQFLNYYPSTVKIFWSFFDNENWTKPEAIENDSRAGCRSASVDHEDNIHIAFNLNDSIMYTFYKENVWSSPINITNSIGYESHEPATIISDEKGNIHISWVSYNYVWPITTKTIFYMHHEAIVSVKEEEINLPIDFLLKQNYPNPFNPNTVIEYSIPTTSFVTLTVYDILGKKIETLVNSELTKGKHSVSFNGSNLSSGCYFYQLNVNEHIITKKMLLIH